MDVSDSSRNSDAIGVLGSVAPERSVMDTREQKMFHGKRIPERMIRQVHENIGVTCTTWPECPPERSVNDRRLDKTYNPNQHSHENYEHRSVMDQMMTNMFNPNHENYCSRQPR